MGKQMKKMRKWTGERSHLVRILEYVSPIVVIAPSKETTELRADRLTHYFSFINQSSQSHNPNSHKAGRLTDVISSMLTSAAD
ncbi:hypothetical protein EAF00_009516 [Botryotinia globosa]|nr:hypothetical protein EAF00_009516 [Botryotinia globosa]